MKLLTLGVLAMGCLAGYAQDRDEIDFQEVYNLIRGNLLDVGEKELSRTAAVGLIKELGAKVQLISTNQAPSTPEQRDAITRQGVFADHFGYIRIQNVDSRLPGSFEQAVGDLIAKHSIKGLVLDLRFASGTDYEAAAKVADVFIQGGELLVNIGGKEVRSTDDSKTIQLPVAILVNQKTSGAAEAIASILRENSAGLVIGAPTAGEARLFETFTLSTGQKLRIGKIPVRLGNGKDIERLSPDLQVSVSPADEQVFFADPFAPLPRALAGSTNLLGSRARPINEAELVRRHRDGTESEPAAAGRSEPERNVVMDPALARALDFLKGLSVLREPRPPGVQ